MKLLKFVLVLTALSMTSIGWSQVKKTVTLSFQVHDKPVIAETGSFFSPWIVADDKMVVVGDKEFDLMNQGENKWKKRKLYNLLSLPIQAWSLEGITVGKSEFLDGAFIVGSHTGPASWNKTKNLMIYSQIQPGQRKSIPLESPLEGVKSGNKKYQYPQLYLTSQKSNGSWEKGKPFEHNSRYNSVSHPALSEDGNTLVFVADYTKDGSKSLFISRFQAGGWSKPELLAFASSTGNDMFPFIQDTTLYFASDRSGGLGGLDLYRVSMSGKYAPENLGPSINSKVDDFGIAFFPGGGAGLFSSNRTEDGKENIFFFRKIETVTIEYPDLEGEFSYRKLQGKKVAGLEVLLLGEDGSVLLSTKTDDNGKFRFKSLNVQGNYVIRLKDMDDETQLVIYNVAGEEVAWLLSNENGEFIYKRLSIGSVGTLALMDNDDIDKNSNMGNVQGQFVYDHLKNKYPSGLKVMLVDEDGNIVMTEYTDAYGNFTFKNLKTDKNYLLRTEKLDDDVTMLIFNRNNKVTAVLKSDMNGTFTYRKLKNEYMGRLDLLDNEGDLKLEDLTANVAGQFNFKKLKRGFGDGLPFEVYDDNGNLIIKGKSEKDGSFRMTNLPLVESYLFKVSLDDAGLEDIELTIVNRFGKKVALLDKDKDGFFVYTPLGLGGALTITQLDNTDKLDVQFANKNIPMIYYASNSTAFDAVSKNVLDDLVTKMKADIKLKIEINSYADSRGKEEYNLKLSDRRTQAVIVYLTAKGIPKTRINGNAYGESNLVNECDKESDCPDELHRLNRRTEFRVY